MNREYAWVIMYHGKYWSSQYAWTDFEHADKFSDVQKQSMVPMGGR